jgi:hypothetical protein
MSSIPLNLLRPGQQFIPAAIFVTTKSVIGWQHTLVLSQFRSGSALSVQWSGSQLRRRRRCLHRVNCVDFAMSAAGPLTLRKQTWHLAINPLALSAIQAPKLVAEI